LPGAGACWFSRIDSTGGVPEFVEPWKDGLPPPRVTANIESIARIGLPGDPAEDSRVDRLQEAGLPFVGIGHTSRSDDMCWIDIDYARLISQSVHHLADLGHTHIALINRSPELLAAGYGPAHRALDGFTTALAERGIEGVGYPCGDDTRAGEEFMRHLLNEHPEITALTTINEAALPGIQHTLETAGLKIPRDFSITGVAAKNWAEDFRPPLTTADVPAHEIGAQAVRLLIERIANPQTPHRHILLSPPISLRSSTGPGRNHRATTLPSLSKPRNSA
jgi:DNA-binding LacI/PurR family transcriptional regulator